MEAAISSPLRDAGWGDAERPLGSARAILGAARPGLPGWRRRAALKGVLLAFRDLIAVEGAERLAALPDPTLFVLNHGNAAEALLVPSVLLYLRGRPLHVLADWIYLHLPMIGGLLRLGDPIPVYGKRARWGLFEGRRRAAFRREPVLDACLARSRTSISSASAAAGASSRSAAS